MALIKCPECNKEISDKSDKCIYCGYPMAKNNLSIINGKQFDLSFILDKNIDKASKTGQFRTITNCGLKEAWQIVDKIISTGEIPPTLIIKSETTNQPKCPTCGSINIEKISIKQKAVGGVLFGLFSSNVRKTMHCKNCGFKW